MEHHLLKRFQFTTMIFGVLQALELCCSRNLLEPRPHAVPHRRRMNIEPHVFSSLLLVASLLTHFLDALNL